jgi:hypothetical protein
MFTILPGPTVGAFAGYWRVRESGTGGFFKIPVYHDA